MVSVTQPLIKEHAKVREIIGETRAHLSRFDLPGLRKSIRDIKDALSTHVLKEESVLYLIGMKFLKADNTLVPSLFKEHHQTSDRINTLLQLLYSGRLTDAEDQIQQLTFLVLESLDHHFNEEETKVFPALEKFIDEKTKELILTRYATVAADGFDELDRAPLISLPDMDNDDSGLSKAIGKV
jgi:iron-sulfur cluster repair protein YtfE (RIC family)